MKTIFKLGAAGILAAGIFAQTVQAGEIRIGITMRMISENGQKYGEMMADEIKAINESGGVNGHTISYTMLNDECKSDKGVANANKFDRIRGINTKLGLANPALVTPLAFLNEDPTP